MPQLKVAIALASLRQPLRRALQTAAQIGADAVELDGCGDLDPRRLSRTGIRQIRKWVEDVGLRVCAVRFRTRRGYDVADELDRRVAATKEAIQLSAAFGAQIVVNHIGRIPSTSEAPQWNLLQQALTDLGNYGQHAGAWLTAETGLESGPDLARLIGGLPEGYLPVALNPGKLIIHGFSVPEAIDHVGRHVLYVYAQDGVRDLARGRGLEVALGRGTADFPELLGRLDEWGYRGYFTALRETADDPTSDLAAAVQFLRHL